MSLLHNIKGILSDTFQIGTQGPLLKRVGSAIHARTFGDGAYTDFAALFRPPAGAAGAGTAPLKLQQGTAQTTPENGAIEDIAGNITWVKSGVRTQLNDQLTTWPGGEPLGFVDRTSSTISWNNTSKKLSVAVKSPATEFVVYEYGGIKYTFTTTQESTISSPAAGVWYFYFESGVLTNSTVFAFTKTLVAFVTLDASNNSIGVTDERHGIVMDWATHEYGHENFGTRWETGLAATRIATGSGSVDGDAQLYLGGGTVWDEDLECVLVRSASPTNDFEQELGTSGVPGKFPIYYRTGSASFNWAKLTTTDFPCYQIGAGQRITYNLDTAGTWSAAQISGNNRFSCMFLVATNSLSEPVICVMGQWDDANLPGAAARTFGDLALGGLPFKEMKPLYKVIFSTSTGHANNIKAYVAQLTDLRNAVNVPSGNFVTTAHNSLSLRDDANCHPATAVSLSTTGFGGNLAVTDDEVQKLAAKFDAYVPVVGEPTKLFGYTIGFPPDVVNNGAVVSFSADRLQWEALNPKDGAVSLIGVTLANGDVPRWDSTAEAWVAVNPVLVRSLSGASIGESSQNTVTPAEKVAPTGSFVVGNYYVKWSCEIKSTTGYNVAGTFLIDAVEVGAMTMDTKGQYVMFGGYILTALAVGIHTFYLKYASGTAAQLAYIRRASVDIVRA